MNVCSLAFWLISLCKNKGQEWLVNNQECYKCCGLYLSEPREFCYIICYVAVGKNENIMVDTVYRKNSNEQNSNILIWAYIQSFFFFTFLCIINYLILDEDTNSPGGMDPS